MCHNTLSSLPRPKPPQSKPEAIVARKNSPETSSCHAIVLPVTEPPLCPGKDTGYQRHQGQEKGKWGGGQLNTELCQHTKVCVWDTQACTRYLLLLSTLLLMFIFGDRFKPETQNCLHMRHATQPNTALQPRKRKTGICASVTYC